jgi:DNA-binding response OmpR family regulator
MNKTIIVLDDQPSVRRLLSQYLGQYYNVIELADANEAISLLDGGYKIDAIIADVFMPEMSGQDFLEKSRKKFGKNMPPVMMLSSSDSYSEKSKSFKQGAQDYMLKPFHPEELRMRLNHVIEKADEITMYIRELESSNNELTQFANMVSHELREPLRMVTSYLCILDRTMSEIGGPMQKDCIEFALKGARRMENMIHDMLRLARIDQDPKLEDVSLQEVAEQVKNNLEILIKEKKGVTFIYWGLSKEFMESK